MIDALGSALFYGGVVTGLVGLLGLIRPPRWLGIRTRRRALLVATLGPVLALGTTLLPTPTRTTAARGMLIDQWLPEWQFGEYHERRIRASPAQLFAAIRRVRSSDIFLFRTLIALRNPSRDGQGEHILNPPEEKPVLDAALAGGFILLGEEADRELLLGAVVIAPPRDRAHGAARERAVAGPCAFQNARPTGLRACRDELPRGR